MKKSNANYFMLVSHRLEPRRIATVPDIVLEVVIGGGVTGAAAGVDNSSLEKKVQDISLSTPKHDPDRARRNPVYGDEMEAMQNYNHIDRPPQVSHLRGPQAILPDPLDISDRSTANKPVQRPATSTTNFLDFKPLSMLLQNEAAALQ